MVSIAEIELLITNYVGVESSYVLALSILVISYIVAKATSFTFGKIVLRLTAKTKTDIDDKIVGALKGPITSSIFIMGLIIFFRYLIEWEKITTYTDGILKTIIVIIWISAGMKIVKIIIDDVAGRLTKRTKTTMDEEFLPLFENIGKIIVIIAGIFAIFQVWSIDITPLLASAGIVGFALAFAAKDTVGNFFGGLSIYLDKSYKIGDYIILDSGERGEVKEIGVRSTRIKTRDNVLITIPNSVMANAKIANQSAPVKYMRLRIPVGVAYGTDIKKVERVLLDVAKKDRDVIEKPGPKVRFLEFGDSALQFELRCWIAHPKDKGTVTSNLNKEIYNRFKKEKIEIPYPQMDVHLKKK